MTLGMVPGYPVLLFEGAPHKLPAAAAAYEVVTLEKSQAIALDQEIRGTGRSADHDFWLNSLGLQGRQVMRAGEVVGYYYQCNTFGVTTWGR